MAQATDTSESATRRAAIVDAATAVFLRYGFKKTSMDDLARAAGISRQGLYLHFATKEALFKEAVLHVVSVIRGNAHAALVNEDASLEDRLVAAFEAAHAVAIGQSGGEHITELLETAAALVGPIEAELAAEIIADVALTLKNAGVAAAWKSAGISAKTLAENLYSTSYGIKHRVKTAAEYRASIRVAVRITCSSAH